MQDYLECSQKSIGKVGEIMINADIVVIDSGVGVSPDKIRNAVKYRYSYDRRET